jgi:hypothetical protein
MMLALNDLFPADEDLALAVLVCLVAHDRLCTGDSLNVPV